MRVHRWDRDEDLLADLRSMRPDCSGATPAYVSAALDAFGAGRTGPGSRLAELAFDSGIDAAPAGMTRSSASVRLLAFRAAGYQLDVEVTDDGLLGQLHRERSEDADLHRGGPAMADGRVIGQTVRGDFDSAMLEGAGGFALRPPRPDRSGSARMPPASPW